MPRRPVGDRAVRRVAALGAGATVLLAAGAWLWRPPSQGPVVGLGGRSVVLVGLPHVGLGDLTSGRLPEVAALARRGAVGALNVRTVSGRPSTVEAYASLGAGGRVPASPAGGLAFDASTTFQGAPSGAPLASPTDSGLVTGVAVVGLADVARRAGGRHLPTAVGALGDALHAAGRHTAVVGRADLYGAQPARPVALALTDSSGAVDSGSVDSPALLTEEPTATGGVAANGAGIVARTLAELERADVVAVDGGDMDRQAAMSVESSPDVSARLRLDALARSDRLVGELSRALPPDAVLMVVSVDPPGRQWRLTPVVISGPGVPHGELASATTHRRGLVTLADMAPTVLADLNVPVRPGMTGHALRARAGPVDLGRLAALDGQAAYREAVYFPVSVVFITLQSLLFMAVTLAWLRGWLRRRDAADVRGGARLCAVAVAAFPLATYAWRAVPGIPRLGVPGGVAVLVAIDAALTAGALALGRARGGARRGVLAPLEALLAATWVVIVVDIWSGGRLQPGSILGYSLHTSTRFFGLSNTALAVLTASTLLWACLHLDRREDRSAAVGEVAVVFAVVVIVALAPMFGAKVGAALTTVPVLGGALWVFSGRRMTARTAVALALAVVAAIAAAALVDVSRAASQRTHLGRLAADVWNHGLTPVRTAVARRISTTVRLATAYFWTVITPVLAVIGLDLLVRQRRAAVLLPPGSLLRTGVVAAFAFGLLALALNDSGAVVTALMFVYVGPLLVLRACHAAEVTPAPS